MNAQSKLILTLQDYFCNKSTDGLLPMEVFWSMLSPQEKKIAFEFAKNGGFKND